MLSGAELHASMGVMPGKCSATGQLVLLELVYCIMLCHTAKSSMAEAVMNALSELELMG